jgi:hypothetical protein
MYFHLSNINDPLHTFSSWESSSSFNFSKCCGNLQADHHFSSFIKLLLGWQPLLNSCIPPYRSMFLFLLFGHCKLINFLSDIASFYSWNASQSQSYFMTGGLLPISSSWWQAPRDSWLTFIFSTEHLRSYIILPDEKMTAAAAGPHQCSHSQVWVPQDSWPHFYCLRLETPPTWRARSPRHRVAQYIPPGTGFPFHRLLWHSSMVEVLEPLLKCLMVSHLILFRLSPFISLGSCNPLLFGLFPLI